MEHGIRVLGAQRIRQLSIRKEIRDNTLTGNEFYLEYINCNAVGTSADDALLGLSSDNPDLGSEKSEPAQHSHHAGKATR